jgi:hypothetical protein
MRNEDYKSKENEYIITVWRLRSGCTGLGECSHACWGGGLF